MQQVLIKKVSAKKKQLGIITLNRPESLNALSGPMILDLQKYLTEFEQDPEIAAVIITGTGRAFCAGGDLKMVYEYGQHNYQEGLFFYKTEYALNLLISKFSKPYLALLNGIAMGGGLGLSLHGTRIIGSEKLQLAMPEVGIGFFPDVGSPHFLATCPHKIGMYLGLTGNCIDINAAVFAKLVDAYIPSNTFDNIIYDLTTFDLSEQPLAIIDSIITRYKQPITTSSLEENIRTIEHCFSKESIEDIIEALENDPSDFAKQQVAILNTRSPTSLKLTLQILKLGAQMPLEECLKMEFNVAKNLMQQHDIYEGIRAAIIDKSHKPNWVPANLSAVTPQFINSLFE